MDKLVLDYNLNQVAAIAKLCVDFTQGVSVITLTGSLGAGKTTLVSAMLKLHGAQGPVISPTFTYVNAYSLADGVKAYHFDLYRLENLAAFEQAGFSEYLYQDQAVCLIEWPAIIESLLTHSVCHISIEFLGLDKRRLTCELKR